MNIHRQNIISICQSLLLILFSLIMGYLYMQDLWFCSFFFLLLLLLVVANINRYQQQQTEAFKKLISAIHFSDFSFSFNWKGQKGIPSSLAAAMDQALTVFRAKLCSLEENQLYYNTLLSTIDSGFIVLNHHHQIEWYNQATLRELQLKSLHQLSDLQNVQENLPETLLNLKAGEIKVVRLEQEGRIREIAFNTILFRVKGKTLSLISLKNLHFVLENNEIEAWQKLIRVLTHEIMNSMAPIISLSETLLERDAANHKSEDTPSINHQALQAIHRRSKGLLEFVQNYRKLTRIPQPEPTLINVQELFSDLQKLHHIPTVRYHFTNPDPGLQIYADRTQIEQVLINLIHNAEEAYAANSSAQIHISAFKYPDKTVISVCDNGMGIVPEAIDKIFVPFFTTKPGGSGIGLSLCKQIMTLHQGNITVSSKIGEGTTFRLVFYEKHRFNS